MLSDVGVTPEDRLGIGCSGGPDSAVLAHAVLGLHARGALGPVVLVHVDHGLRPDSADDAAVVHELARHRGRVVTLRVEVDRSQASLERAARDARYQAFERAAGDHDLRWMLLAHTASDQAETVLMRVVRGTGVTGLAGIPPRRGMYLRPLIQTPRADIEAYLTEQGVPHTRDPMNQDAAFLRNRVRHTWLPRLRAENPNLDEALCRLAESARQQAEALDFAAELLLDQARAPGAEHTLSVPVLGRAPAAVVRRALALAAERAGSTPLEACHQRAVHDLVARPASGTLRLDLPGVRAIREYQTLRLVPARPGAPARPDVDIVVSGPAPPYIIRCWQPGDRMRPARLKGRSRKLSDLFIDAKVPRHLRTQALVVERQSDGTIEWVQYIGPAWGSGVDVVLTSPDPVATNKPSV